MAKTLEEYIGDPKKKPHTPHVVFKPQYTYWEKCKIAGKLLLGADLYASFCNVFQASFSSKDEFLGLEYIDSTYQLVVSLGEPKKHEIELLDLKHSPVTAIKVTKIVDVNGKSL